MRGASKLFDISDPHPVGFRAGLGGATLVELQLTSLPTRLFRVTALNMPKLFLIVCPTVICTLELPCVVVVVTEGRLRPDTVRCFEFELQEDPYTMSQNL